MSVKLLISGTSNSGKTTLTKSLDPKRNTKWSKTTFEIWTNEWWLSELIFIC